MNNFPSIVIAIIFSLITISQTFAGTTRKNVKSGESVVVYQTAFMGVPPKGIKAPEPLAIQPKNGTLKVKKEVKGSGRSKTTIYSFVYKSKRGFKGKDTAKAIMNYFIRKRDGSQSKAPRTENLIIRVR